VKRNEIRGFSLIFGQHMQPQRVSVDFTQSPPVYIPPGLKGEITSLNQNDVLCGRGSAISNYSGNIQLRALAAAKREVYMKHSMKIEKAYICAQIVVDIRSLSPSGRFLEREENSLCWTEIGDIRARKKVAQALRESASARQERKRQDRCRFPTDFQCLTHQSKNINEEDSTPYIDQERR
jgi:hypothetical protein